MFEDESAATPGDPARVRQILRTLVSNALKCGGESLGVRIGYDAGKTVVKVEDDGEGMPPEESETIFKPYRRAHDAPGLAISRQLARLMNGDLGYTRNENLTIFTLSGPIAN